MSRVPLLLVIGGPTGAGKTALAVELYRRWGWPIISADSRQVYRYLDIGTNKVSQSLQAEVPHFLIDVCFPDEVFSAGRFVSEVDRLLSLWGDMDVVQVVGGTGFYVHSLLYGLDPMPVVSQEMRSKVEAWIRAVGLQTAIRWLQEKDPLTADQIDLSNPRRLQRAIEVLWATGRPWVSFWRQRNQKRYPALVVVVSLPREDLYSSIGARTRRQVAAGWLEETQYILQQGYLPTDPALQTLGYKECLQVLDGERAIGTLIEAIAQANRKYARRQLTWWRNHPYDLWFEEEVFSVRLREVERRVLDYLE
ncbi:MAG: tRNA (adenosine(37)-N6)-dimethylallyltransferase MiaA [Bacteroidia bacterium]|nr:tRNA (adenosine(37)-N6)-dimethylallyltransferase MiaA [Bacteroidia bacterium]